MESTGLDPHMHSIIEFGAVLDDLECPFRLDELPTFHCYFIQDNYVGSPFALSMHPEILRRIAEREPPHTYVKPMKFGHMFKKFLLENEYEEDGQRVYINAAGKNFAACDLQFLKMQTDIEKHVRIRHKVLDPGPMFMRVDDEQIPGLSECKERAGLDNVVAHDAVSDAMDVVKLIRWKMLGRI